jgi:type II secretory pathway pseudopilin PulG
MKRGFSLIELVVALVVLELAVTGIAGILAAAGRAFADAERLERAIEAAEWVADSLTSEGMSGVGAVPFPGGVVGWGAGPWPGEAIVWSADRAGDTLLRVPVRVGP